jgi:hypothetical protein
MRPVLPRHRLGEILVDRGLVSEPQVAAALARQTGRGRLGETLVGLGLIRRRQLHAALVEQYRRRLFGALGLAMLSLQPGAAFAGSARGVLTVSATVVNSGRVEVQAATPQRGGTATAGVTLSCAAGGSARVAFERSRVEPASGRLSIAWSEAAPRQIPCTRAPQALQGGALPPSAAASGEILTVSIAY